MCFWDKAEERSLTSRRARAESRGSAEAPCGPWPQRGSRWPLVPGHSGTPRWCTWYPWITPPPGRASGPDLLNNDRQKNVPLVSLVIRSIDSLIQEVHSSPDACPSSPFCPRERPFVLIKIRLAFTKDERRLTRLKFTRRSKDEARWDWWEVRVLRQVWLLLICLWCIYT